MTVGPTTPIDVVVDVCLLSDMNLPCAIANKIVAMAGLSMGFVMTMEEKVPARCDGVSVTVPADVGHDALEFSSCVQMVIECTSAIQSSVATDHAQPDATRSTNDESDTGDVGFEIQDASGNVLLPRRHLHSFRPSWPFQTSRAIGDRDVLSCLVPGHRVVVYVGTRYAGFTTTVRIHLDCSVALKETVDTHHILRNFNAGNLTTSRLLQSRHISAHPSRSRYRLSDAALLLVDVLVKVLLPAVQSVQGTKLGIWLGLAIGCWNQPQSFYGHRIGATCLNM
ncbi:Aste57867_22428 [Aphanomyces stellatus]|uniref:Aste57867_22428 protein n=1 Tax=Aphanomyces stellatus TaxID=120398 RepID=A0A485LKB7_9STRA|nr:hypothetical protein As57867_022358 [Aphanomyces stellatus]VFT99090.1 Aste57867_22428 [Aphanomyces stellatus]